MAIRYLTVGHQLRGAGLEGEEEDRSVAQFIEFALVYQRGYDVIFWH